MKPPSALRDRVLASAAARPSPTRKEGKRIGVVLLALSLIVAVVVIEVAGGLSHGAGRPLPVTAGVVGGCLGTAVLLTWLIARRRGSNLARRATILLGAALAAPAVLFVWMHLFYGTYEEPFARFGWRCLGYTLLIAMTPLASFLFLRRGIEPRRPMAVGAIVGAACGAWAGVVVDLWCPLTNPSHVLVGHVTPLALLIGIGALLGHRLLGVRRLGS